MGAGRLRAADRYILTAIMKRKPYGAKVKASLSTDEETFIGIARLG
jgi:hypothetical protein